MKLSSVRSKGRLVLVGAATGGLLLTAGVAVAGPDHLLSQHGGATRLHSDQTVKIKRAVVGGRAHNVILLIGDGMGDSEITSARNYQFGADGRFPGIDGLPLAAESVT
jgi:alkaline phosphatase